MSAVQEPPTTTGLHFVDASTLSGEMRERVRLERERLQKTVPRVHEPEQFYSWVLFDGDEPIGSFAAVPYIAFGESFAEVGLRVWKPGRDVLEAGRNWIAHYLNTNSYLFGRVFPDNKPVKRLVQLLGFRLTGYDVDLDGRVVERYVIRRGELVGPRPKDILAR